MPPVTPVQVTILAAGMGTRLGRPAPKPLTPSTTGARSSPSRLDNVREVLGEAARLVVVVGFKHEPAHGGRARRALRLQREPTTRPTPARAC
ncbi:hypothetical protein GCM10025868_36460 [Angustibacter aerolatus]|uniref:MobA-like NTP transferase domain-containing protein n=1 Tax=Angustibacter aerolatus TaxID=1162965 RepID=A0ABQ6JLG1_9ACTN|nr:hypothetical protein [Angustibacter aerolatus]GMA88396.1 hypothetical protein GCM10025868_36460 [Angustibacter aerolatus]